MKYQRVLITGCGGMLGNAIYPYFRERVPHLLATDRQIEPDERSWLSYLDAQDEGAMAKTFDEFKDVSEKLFLQHKLAENEWNVKRTAEALGMQRSHLYKKIERYGLK